MDVELTEERLQGLRETDAELEAPVVEVADAASARQVRQSLIDYFFYFVSIHCPSPRLLKKCSLVEALVSSFFFGF